jgi:hypothetical protein
MKFKKPFIGIIAFLLVLLTMPLGHAAVILLELAFGSAYQFHAALLLGFMGVLILFAGVISKKELPATLLGLFGGFFVWTGWIEFSFIYFAGHLGVEPQIIDGVTVTKPEYLIMQSTVGIWAAFMLYYFLGTKTGCRFFIWLQKHLKINNLINLPEAPRNIAVHTFMELIMLLWSFYLLLLFVYDPNFAGDKHPATYIVLFGTLLWSLILFVKLIKISKFAYAVRYAIPTVVIFWTSVEIMGRWNLLEEIWINPAGNLPEIIAMSATLIILIVFIIFAKQKNEKEN